jgi:hypothetical protein
MSATLDQLTMNAKGIWEGIADPEDDLDYVFNFADFLNPISDSIASYVITETGCTTHDDAIVNAETSDDVPVTVTNGGVRVFIKDGMAGVKATITCEITTASSPPRVKQQTLTLKMQER